MPGPDQHDSSPVDREPRSRLGRVGQFLALVTALAIDLTIRHLFGA
ncbi:hypothetical protein [Streptomyces paromomycinus]|uniref:Uncharacterized protein n=1 Tax=Streptomyces paromomycinus TaxID=92743 RepID=A0A401VTF6_STREY|nr:hypothetical protein [Streptomyces paromomycinus]GCD40364.1 hypothetical protein GKJPGBOP_00013 [Streptomyces paromomycinus]